MFSDALRLGVSDDKSIGKLLGLERRRDEEINMGPKPEGTHIGRSPFVPKTPLGSPIAAAF